MASTQIYKATYSGVPVYEYPCKGTAVMRRVSDGWVNATHILKVAGFDKPQRTKILERDVQKGVHEKVQGGYGRYQGTWVPLDKARGIASNYNVEGDLEPLFGYQAGQGDSPPPAPKAGTKQRSARPSAAGGGAPVGAKRARKSATMPTTAAEGEFVKKRRGRPPSSAKLTASAGGGGGSGSSGPGSLSHSQSSQSQSQSRQLPGIYRSHMSPYAIEDHNSASVDSASVSSRSSSPSEFMSDNDLDAALNNGYSNGTGLGLKHERLNGSRDDYSLRGGPGPGGHGFGGPGGGPGGPAGPGGVGPGAVGHFMQGPGAAHGGASPSTFVAADYNSRLLNFFMAPDDEHIPDFITRPPPGFKINQVIDDEGHTAFHWSCAMGILKIIEILINIGADINAVNLLGHTPLMRSIMYTNNFDRRTFPRVVELLRETIFHVDSGRRTVLHHIASTAASRSKLSSARYYLEILLAKVSESQPMHELIRFLDRQDDNGDTALHIVARHGARKCIKVLLSYHASVDLANKQGETAYMLVYPDETLRPFLQRDYSGQGGQHLHQAFNSSSSPVQHHQSSRSFGPYTPDYRGTDYGRADGGASGASGIGAVDRRSSGFGSAVPNGGRFVANPHVAEAAIRATQQIAPTIADQLEALANAYDAELREKDWDLSQVQQLLADIQSEAVSTDMSIKNLESQLGDEPTISAKKDELYRLMTTRSSQLNKLLERSQSRDLAQLVQQEESRAQGHLMQTQDGSGVGSGGEDDGDVIALANELIELQSSRRQMVEEITHLYESAGIGAKMNDYRRLVATSCGVKVEEIDDLLDGIAQALAENNEDDEDMSPDGPEGLTGVPGVPGVPEGVSQVSQDVPHGVPQGVVT